MQGIKTFVSESLSQAPNPVQNILVALFKIWVGAWLILPVDSLNSDLFTTLLFSPLNEHVVGGILVSIGVTETFFLYRSDWINSAKIALFVTTIWTFLAVGYLQADPGSILSTTFSFFAIFSGYKYLYFRYYAVTHKPTNLPNNQKIDNI